MFARLEPTPLELASSTIVGFDPALPPLVLDDVPAPAAALEAAILPFLERPPCVVAFSGGRDSSIVLAAAARVSRREGLPAPIAMSWIHDEPEQAGETAAQEAVVRHLELRDWERLPENGRLDALGPLAQAILLRHGVVYPGNSHLLTPFMERAAGGTLLTGWGGHEVLRLWRWARARTVLAGRARAVPRDLLRVGALAVPRPFLRELLRYRMAHGIPQWLTVEARATLLSALAPDRADEPRRWDERVAWIASRRFLSITGGTLALLAQAAGAQIFHPLLDRGFLVALAVHGGRRGWGEWRIALPAIFGDFLPRELLARRSATFPNASWGPAARAFAAGWESGGVDTSVVSEDRLRAAWRGETLARRSVHLLQSAWLAEQAGA